MISRFKICLGIGPTVPVWYSANAPSMATMAVLDFGDNAMSITATESGMRASGKPTLNAASHAATTFGPMAGFAKPISS